MLLSRSELLVKMKALEAMITNAERKNVAAPAEPVLRKSRVITKLGRLISPGQIMRFPSEAEWSSFKDMFNVPEDAYVRIEHTDPLGFDGDTPTHHPDGANNPKNYLRRVQLPPMKIDMTNVYCPSVLGELANDEANDVYMPFLGHINGHYFPQVKGPRGYLCERRFPVVDSFMPKVMTCAEGIKMMGTYGQWMGYTFCLINSHKAFISDSWSHSSPRFYLVTAPHSSKPVPQSIDCSAPTLGCFWFNDGRRGQIELPKDPDCRAGVVVRFKKYVLL